jgi:hypothetical protein
MCERVCHDLTPFNREGGEPTSFMTVRGEIAESPGETGAWSRGTDTLLRVRAWCLSPFRTEQRHWLEMIRDHVAANLVVEPDDFEYAPFAQEGGLGKVHQLFPDGLQTIIDRLNVALVA